MKTVLLTWFGDYFSDTKVLILIDTDINTVRKCLVERDGSDIDFATNEYFVLQNNYFKAIIQVI